MKNSPEESYWLPGKQPSLFIVKRNPPSSTFWFGLIALIWMRACLISGQSLLPEAEGCSACGWHCQTLSRSPSICSPAPRRQESDGWRCCRVTSRETLCVHRGPHSCHPPWAAGDRGHTDRSQGSWRAGGGEPVWIFLGLHRPVQASPEGCSIEETIRKRITRTILTWTSEEENNEKQNSSRWNSYYVWEK